MAHSLHTAQVSTLRAPASKEQGSCCRQWFHSVLTSMPLPRLPYTSAGQHHSQAAAAKLRARVLQAQVSHSCTAWNQQLQVEQHVHLSNGSRVGCVAAVSAPTLKRRAWPSLLQTVMLHAKAQCRANLQVCWRVAAGSRTARASHPTTLQLSRQG